MSDEFASSAMLRVLSQGLKELGLPPLQAPHVNQVTKASAKVDLDDKQAVVQHALHHGGVGCLIHLGRGIQHYVHEPTHRAMMSARDPIEMVERWQRLERYIHSRHRLCLANKNERSFDIHHEGTREGVSPSLYESLVVLGVIAALLEALGVKGLEINNTQVQVFPDGADSQLSDLAVFDPKRTWRVSWKAFLPSTEVKHSPVDPDYFYEFSRIPHWQVSLSKYILQSLIDNPSISDAASVLHVSPRTMQRNLRESNLSFSGLVSDCRSRVASKHLIESTLSLAEIGFLCGYSDQSHFTRDFGKRVGLTPQKYRLAFGLS